MELARQSIMIRELFLDEQKKNAVTDAEIQAEYDKFVAANSGKETRPATSWSKRKKRPRPSPQRSRRAASSRTSPKKQSKDPGSGARAATSD